MLYHRGDLEDFNTISIELQSKLDILNEAVEVIALEVCRELGQEGFDVLKIDELLLVAKFKLE